MTQVHSAMVDDALEATLLKLLAYCDANGWAGYDPYDALNSRVFEALPFLNSRLPRLVLTQAMKRSPINLRPLLLVPKTPNPKALALFLSALLKLDGIGHTGPKATIQTMIEQLISLRSTGVPYWCWGYSFPWQTRTELVPRGAPNLVSTTFAANAFLDAYECQGNPRFLEIAASAAWYMINDLYWAEGSSAGFAYPRPTMRNQVHNANFLAAALLCRVHHHTGDAGLLEPAFRAARASASRQAPNGSWAYGEGKSQSWIDNFHTGYNLCALRSIARHTGTAEFDECITRGFAFYRDRFFCPDGSVRYYHDRDYPKDIHCVAQALITLIALDDLDPSSRTLAQSALRWALERMWDENGFFYYRVLRTLTVRTSYMRWSQAWMLLALATMLEHSMREGTQQTQTSAMIARVDANKASLADGVPSGPGSDPSPTLIRATTVRSYERMRYAGETACATTGKSFACIGGACFSLPTPACGRIFSHLLREW